MPNPQSPPLSDSQKSEARFRAIYENAPFMINSFRQDGKLALWNRACEEQLGYSMAEVNEAPDSLGLFYPEPEVRQRVMETIFEKDGKFREYKVLRKDGKYVYQMWANFALPDGSAISVGYDITEMRENREKLSRMNQWLEEEVVARSRDADEQRSKLFFASKFVALGEMAGGVAHEINNPLAVISGYASQLSEMLSKPSFDHEAVEEMLASIRNSTNRITKIIAGLRNLARDGRRDPMVECRVLDVINDALSFCRARYSAAGVELELSLEERDAKIRGRPVELGQVLLNLLNNTFDAVDGSADAWVRLRLAGDDKNIFISVTDSGPGVPEHLKQKLFHPFFTTKPVGKGMGLGLSISKGILEAHGGTLELRDEGGHTCFIAKIPRF